LKERREHGLGVHKMKLKLTFLFLVLGVLVGADAKDRKAVRTDLDAVRAKPQAWLDTPIEFEARYHALGEIYQPFYTQFDAFSFANFSAWDVTKDLSTKDGFTDHCQTLYISRQMNSDALEKLGELAPYQRFRARAIVRSVFSGRAFVEVTDVKPLDAWFWWDSEDHRRAAFAGNHR
jgi:hypothetical protein